jgi:hypothetical protein
MDEVSVETDMPQTRVVLRPAVALAIGIVVGVGVGIAVAAALTKVGKEYGETTAKHAAPLGSVVVEDEPDEPDQIVIED